MDVPPVAVTPAVDRALTLLRERDAETLDTMVELAQIPAPPFGEAARAERVRDRFHALGLADVVTDEEGNVLARLPSGNGTGLGAPVIVAAHLDTVFPAETDLTVRRDGRRLAGPGIVDNARGLAALLTIAGVLCEAGVATCRPVVFAATVGEEGTGDLRGVKHLFREGSPWRRASGFIALDGTGTRRIVNSAVGSRRFRLTVRGSGGHSWADWGRANPIHALGLAVAEIARYAPPRRPRTTLTVGRIEGGTSVNAIPSAAWLEVDLRSEGRRALANLEARVLHAAEAAVAETNARRRRGTPALGLEIALIGDRPSGETPATAPIVEAACNATRMIGETPELVASSTDANVPISLGIPAITIGAGGRSAGTHTTEEWYDNETGPQGLERVLWTVLGVAGVETG